MAAGPAPDAAFDAADPTTPGIPTVPVAAETLAGPATATPGAAAPGAPAFDPNAMNFGATDPLTVPEGPKAPDPVEEELKMPLKAAEPVPGSIGSAVSMPAGQDGVAAPAGQTPSVAFNDPAAMQNTSEAKDATKTKPAKKMNKTTLIIAGVLALVVIIALVVILITLL